MPVTAKLSRRFYETFGDDIANELVEWFNQVDATYRADLRELNELNFARFDAKLEQRVIELDAKLEKLIAELDAKFEQRIALLEREISRQVTELRSYFETRLTELDSKLELRLAELRSELESKISQLDLRVTGLRADLIKWMFVFWIGTLAPLAGLIVVLTR